MKISKLDFKLDIDKTQDEIEQTRMNLDRLINSEDFSSAAIDEFEKQVEQINEILFKLNTNNRTDPNTWLEKSTSLKQVGNTLIQVANKYQESLSKNLLQQIEYIALWFYGTAKQYKIHAFTKQTLEPSEEDVIQLLKLVTDFVTHHWETHSEEILEREETALDIAEAIKLEMLDKISSRTEEVIHQLITITLSAADKVRLKKLKDSAKSVDEITDWMINTPGWQGDDLEYCLEIVKNSRVQAEF